jgi:histone H3/H4
MSSAIFSSLLSTAVGSSCARQLALGDFLGTRNWSVDIDAGTVQFGKDLQYPMQLLGTESNGDDSWLWAWANQASPFPDAHLQHCLKLRDIGTKKKIPEFAERSFPLSIASGYEIGTVASALLGNAFYYRAPHNHGALVFTIQDLPAELLQRAPIERVVRVIQEVVDNFDINAQAMCQQFLIEQQFDLSADKYSITAKRGRNTIELHFDEQERLIKLEGDLHPETPPKKPWWRIW